MNTVDDFVVETKESSDREHPRGRTRIRLLTLCPKDQGINKRIKVMEPNVSPARHGRGQA